MITCQPNYQKEKKQNEKAGHKSGKMTRQSHATSDFGRELSLLASVVKRTPYVSWQCFNPITKSYNVEKDAKNKELKETTRENEI